MGSKMLFLIEHCQTRLPRQRRSVLTRLDDGVESVLLNQSSKSFSSFIFFNLLFSLDCLCFCGQNFLVYNQKRGSIFNTSRFFAIVFLQSTFYVIRMPNVIFLIFLTL